MDFNMGYQLLWLFFIYSFLGWVGESIYAAIRQKQFVNRGLLNGPLCCIYGVAALVFSLGLQELDTAPVFLFLGSAILGGLIEWLTGRLLERFFRRRWWDYSRRRFNLDGYVSLESFLLWGVGGTLGILFVNPLLLTGFAMLPQRVVRIALLVVLGLSIVDAVGTVCALLGLERRERQLQQEINARLLESSNRLNAWIVGRVSRRMKLAHPSAARRYRRPADEAVFASGCGFYKVVWLFVLGSLLGDIVETIFCRFSMGYWMSRSSLVWGPFSIVWGFALAVGTVMLYNYRDRSDSFLFLFGTFLGGAYEYLCSVLSELAFGKVFWDYSEIPFNLGGRINLLYCFFWGIAAVLWLKYVYPAAAKWIERIPIRVGTVLTWVMVVFMVCNMAVSFLALVRSAQREAGVAATNVVEELLDTYYSDEVLDVIYPAAKSTQ
ncbi:MAG: putative ABC transporter permease [Clostridiales bacterium]|nr:putative ABC transporter permease [Clostridiales bacterium]